MSADEPLRLAGGCQCGAVRFAVAGRPKSASLCHCRMCQKAFGGPYGMLAAFDEADVTWTRGAPRLFASSDLVERGFCGNCGTPLTYRIRESGLIDLAIAAFDDPAAIPPTVQLSVETRIPFIDHVASLPARPEDPKYFPMLDEIARTTRQHPDHDTPNDGPDAWVPAGSSPP